MPDKPYTSGTVYEALTAFFGGVNSGLNPLLLQRDQLAFATNATVRGGFITHRPPYRKMELEFNADTALQSAFEDGFYQGGVPYRPDFGNHSLMAAISGKLFKLAISGRVATVTDVSIPGDPNPAITSQAWLWQSEKWIIWQNGLNLPVFFDGATSRRSFGPTQLLATAIAFNPASPPDVGQTVDVTLSAPYTGPFNIPVVFNNAFYQPVAAAAGYKVVMNIGLIQPGGPLTFNTGEDLVIRPDIAGYVWSTTNSATSFTSQIFVGSNTIAVGETLSYGGEIFTVLGVQFPTPFPPFAPYPPGGAVPNGNNVKVTLDKPMFPSAAAPQVFRTGSTSPVVIVGSLTAPVVFAPGDASENGFPDGYFSGPNGQTAWAADNNGFPRIFTLNVGGPPAPALSLTLINLSDTPATIPVNYTNPSLITSVPELPTGRMGVYVMGRNWMSLVDGISFIAGNIVGGEAGTQAEAYRDAVLKTTENDYLDTGTFRLPGSGDVITAICATANLDASMGQGALIVCTANSIFTCNAPVDRTEWQNLTFPILAQTLLGSGALAQQSTFPVNSDTFMRANDGWRSYKIARRNFSEEWGNTPITREMERVLNLEDKTLIPYVSGMLFDNRVLFGARPQSTASGISSTVSVALNFDPVSSIAGKSPPIYDGAWGNLNVLQFMRATIDSEDRGFAFVANTTTQKIELWELLPGLVMDERLAPSFRVLADNDGTTDTPITWNFESCVLFKETPGRPLLQLLNGEIRVSDVVGTVDFQVWYKADNYPCWTPWHRWSICSNQPTTEDVDIKPAYNPRMGLGEPKLRDTVNGVEVVYCDEFTQRPLREGYTFQFKISVRGHCKFIGMTVAAVRMPEVSFAKPICEFSEDP